jgi:hypothetical protein
MQWADSLPSEIANTSDVPSGVPAKRNPDDSHVSLISLMPSKTGEQSSIPIFFFYKRQ